MVLVAIGFSKRKVGGFAEEADVVEGAAPEPEHAGTASPG